MSKMTMTNDKGWLEKQLTNIFGRWFAEKTDAGWIYTNERAEKIGGWHNKDKSGWYLIAYE